MRNRPCIFINWVSVVLYTYYYRFFHFIINIFIYKINFCSAEKERFRRKCSWLCLTPRQVTVSVSRALAKIGSVSAETLALFWGHEDSSSLYEPCRTSQLTETYFFPKKSSNWGWQPSERVKTVCNLTKSSPPYQSAM